jgi:hypothetical protein
MKTTVTWGDNFLYIHGDVLTIGILFFDFMSGKITWKTMNYLFLRLNDTFSIFSFNFCLVFPQEIVSLKLVLFHFVLYRFDSFR